MRPGLPGRPRRANPDGTMSLVAHVYELRRRLAIAIAAVAAGTVIGFAWYEHAVLGLPSLGSLLTGPYCSLPASARADLAGGDSCRLLATGPLDQFVLRLKVAATAGVVLSTPVWLGQLWGFITPGLHVRERRTARWFIATASMLFAGGAVLAYLVVASALTFLLSIGGSVQTTALLGAEYFSMVLALIVIFGVSFLTPLLVVALNRAGVLTHARLARCRRGIIVGIFAFAGIATPGGDPISMVALASTLCVLVELAIQICRVHDRRAARRNPWAGLADNDASPLPPDASDGSLLR